ncbi:hypothetical protein SCAR479_05982 [Seiridium cardinale]|uniref:Uncharacterized protein n=1 Tax=Seiridium cardinale TaxID=138064 RepID=A0ABR2XTY4_9PEZI
MRSSPSAAHAGYLEPLRYAKIYHRLLETGQGCAAKENTATAKQPHDDDAMANVTSGTSGLPGQVGSTLIGMPAIHSTQSALSLSSGLHSVITTPNY